MSNTHERKKNFCQLFLNCRYKCYEDNKLNELSEQQYIQFKEVYNESGLLISKQTFQPDGEEDELVEYEYNDQGNLIQEEVKLAGDFGEKITYKWEVDRIDKVLD